MRLLTLLLSLLACTSGLAQSDSFAVAPITVPLTTITAYGNLASDPQPAATISIEGQELRRYDQSSLTAALNRLPGVRFEERATASYRVAIRGASLRSPFGVRNTQVYWNGIPYGEPGGDVPLNFLDAVNIDRVEALRGPSGGFYGPGTAGTLLLNTDLNARQPSIETSLTAGSYGFLRADATLTRSDTTGFTHQARIGYQRTDGYRDHSAMDRLTGQYSVRINRGRSSTRLHALYTALSYELPGGLNAEQYADNPRQARPGSAEKNASINYHNVLLGVTNRNRIGRWTSEFSGYLTGFYFDHPFNFDYKRETNLGGGTRLSFRRYFATDMDVVAGVESRLQMRFGNNFTNPDGTRPGDLNFSDEIFSQEQLLFAQLRYQPDPWDFTLGLSSSSLSYRVDRTFDGDGNTGEINFTSDRPISVRVAVGRQLGQHHYVFANRTDGFSPPTLDEFRTNEGSLNTDLAPEIGTNYEVGYRGGFGKWSVNATVFHFRLDEAITSFADERGTQLFRNSGRTTQNGLELMVQFRRNNVRSAVRQDWDYHLLSSLTYYDFTYDELQRAGTDFSGNDIPGAAPITTNLEGTVSYKDKWQLSLLHNYVDDIPLNDANDVFAESFHLIRASVSYRLKQLTIFVNGSNLLDERMSFGNDLNPRFGGRYFQPAAGRNFQVGVRWRKG